jgi:hypothetical protein
VISTVRLRRLLFAVLSLCFASDDWITLLPENLTLHWSCSPAFTNRRDFNPTAGRPKEAGDGSTPTLRLDVADSSWKRRRRRFASG